MFGKITEVENPGAGRPEQEDDLKSYGVTKGSTNDDPTIIGTESFMWTIHERNSMDKGVCQEGERFTESSHMSEKKTESRHGEGWSGHSEDDRNHR